METKGKKYLNVVGAIMVIIGVVGSVLYIMGFMGSGLLFAGSVIEGAALSEVRSTVLLVIFGFGLVWSILELVTGVIGMKSGGDPEKSGLCFKLGLVLAAFAVVSTVGQMCIQGISVMGVSSLLIGLILPCLFCYGAKLNKKSE